MEQQETVLAVRLVPEGSLLPTQSVPSADVPYKPGLSVKRQIKSSPSQLDKVR